MWQTASLYHLLHAAVLLCIAGRPIVNRFAFRLFAIGIVLFSGSLYALAITSIKQLGGITPLGGLLLIAGWIALCVAPPSPQQPA